MKFLKLVIFSMLLSSCGYGYVPPIVNTVPAYNYPQVAQPQYPYYSFYYYCYYQGMIVRRNNYHPRFNNKWLFSAYEVCL